MPPKQTATKRAGKPREGAPTWIVIHDPAFSGDSYTDVQLVKADAAIDAVKYVHNQIHNDTSTVELRYFVAQIEDVHIIDAVPPKGTTFRVLMTLDEL